MFQASSHPHCSPRVSLNAFKKLVAFLELPRQGHVPFCFPVHDQRLSCVLKGYSLALAKNHLNLPCLGGLVGMEDNFLGGSGGGF